MSKEFITTATRVDIKYIIGAVYSQKQHSPYAHHVFSERGVDQINDHQDVLILVNENIKYRSLSIDVTIEV